MGKTRSTETESVAGDERPKKAEKRENFTDGEKKERFEKLRKTENPRHESRRTAEHNVAAGYR